MSTSKRHLAVCVFGLIAVLPANAYFTSFTGHAGVTSPTVDGSIHYTVLDLSDPADRAWAGALQNDFMRGENSPGLDLNLGGYVYLYQPINDAYVSGARALSSFTNSLGTPTGGPFCWGHFARWTFTDGGIALSRSPMGDVPDGPGLHLDGPPGVSLGLLGNVANLVAPTNVRINPLTDSIIAYYSNSLPKMQISEIVAFVSPDPPAWFTGSLIDGGQGGYGRTPAPVPAPQATLLGVVGLATLGLFRRR